MDGKSYNKLLIVGASGHGKVVADIALKTGRYIKIAFVDDNLCCETVMDIEVIGGSGDITKYIDAYEVVVAVGNNQVREKLQNNLESLGAVVATLIHPSAVIGEQSEIGAGSVIMAGAVINPATVIGKGCIINTGATVDHDNIIEDYVHVSPGAHLAGTVCIGRRTWVCIGASIINNINVVSDCKIGAGAVVVENITESGTYIGVPAKCIGGYSNSTFH